MKIHTASIISGILFVAIGIFLWIRFDASSKWFSLAANFVTTGLAVIVITALSKIGR